MSGQLVIGRIGENAARAERARTKLHAVLEPADHIVVGEQSRDCLSNMRRVNARVGDSFAV